MTLCQQGIVHPHLISGGEKRWKDAQGLQDKTWNIIWNKKRTLRRLTKEKYILFTSKLTNETKFRKT